MLRDESEGFLVFLLVVTALFCLARDFVLFRYLPYYKVHVLKATTIWHAIATSHAIAMIFGYALKDSSFKTGFTFVTMTSIVLSIIMIPIYLNILKTRIRHVVQLCPKTAIDPYLIVHKHHFYEYFESTRINPHQKTRRVDGRYMVYRIGI